MDLKFDGVTWLAGLLLALVVLFLVAYLRSRQAKAKLAKPQKSLNQLQKSLQGALSPDILVANKSNRLLILKQGICCAIITMDQQAVRRERYLDGVLIINVLPNYGQADFVALTQKIHQQIDEKTP